MNTKRTRRDRGETTIEVLIGLGVSAVVTAGFLAFWVSTQDEAKQTSANTVQQSSALNTLNRISREVRDTNAVLFADPDELVVETKGTTIRRVRYSIDNTAHTLKEQVWSGAPTVYNYASPGWDAIGSKTVATSVEDNLNLFSYFDANGDAVAVTNASPALGTGTGENVQRVDVNFKADAGKGYVELKTSTAIAKRKAGGGAVAAAPSCPTASIAAYPAAPKIDWEAVSGATSYAILRNGATITTVAAVTNKIDYTYTDPAALAGGTTYIYTMTVSGPGGSASCSVGSYSITVPPPSVTAAVLTGANGNQTQLTWTPVSGATGYKVYERTASTSTFIGSGSFAEVHAFNNNTPNSGANFQVTLTPGFGVAREYYVVATSAMGDSVPSNQFSLLTEPGTVAPTAVPTTYNVNTVTWSLPASADRATVIRTPSGGPATTGAVSTTATTSFVDTLAAGGATSNQATLGYTYAYTLQASNNGPRTQAGTSSRRDGLAGSSNSALQFPPDPASVTAAGTESNVDGTNSASWASTRSATGYRVGTYWGSSDAGTPVQTWTVGAVVSATDGSEARGTRKFYEISARNATGDSPNYVNANTLTAVAYQRPAAPSALTYQSETDRPTISSNTATLQWDKVAGTAVGVGDNTPAGTIPGAADQPSYPDDGNPAGFKFCTTNTSDAAACRYVFSTNTGGSAVTKNISTRTQALSGLASGAAVNYQVVACNTGGCSEPTPAVVNTFPGSFAPDNNLRSHGQSSDVYGNTNNNTSDSDNRRVGYFDYDRGLSSGQWDNFDIKPQARNNMYTYNTNGNTVSYGQVSQNGKLKMRWSASAGTGVTYNYSYYAANDAQAITVGASGLGRSGGRSGINYTYSGASGGDGEPATPGSRVYYTVRSNAANGLWRLWTTPDSAKYKNANTNPSSRLSGVGASDSLPGISVQTPTLAPSDTRNRGLCNVFNNGNPDTAGGWGSMMLVGTDVQDSTKSNQNVKIDNAYIRVAYADRGNGLSGAQLVDKGIADGYSTSSDANQKSIDYGNGGATLNIQPYTQTSASTAATMSTANTEPYGNYGAFRVIAAPWNTNLSILWTARGHVSSGISGNAPDAADQGYGWSVSKLSADTQSSNNNYMDCSGGLENANYAWGGGKWPRSKGVSYSYWFDQVGF